MTRTRLRSTVLTILAATTALAITMLGLEPGGIMSAKADPVTAAFVPLSGRLLDTRTTTQLNANSPRSIPVTGQLGIPTTGVTAVALTVTALNFSSSCNIWLNADGAANPGTSALNYTTVNGGPVSNTAVVPVSQSSGAIEISSCATTDVILDVEGYYTTVNSGTGSFTTVAPTRLVDTRSGLGAPATQLSPGHTLTVQIGGNDGIPNSGVAAAAVNVTVVNSGGTHASWIEPYATGSSLPGTSQNFMASASTALGSVVKLNSTGSFSIFLASSASAPVDIIVDIEGYYSASTANTFTPAPKRIYDSPALGATLASGATTTVPVSGMNGIPDTGVTSAILNVEVTPTVAAHGYVEVFDSNIGDPGLSSVNYSAPATVSNQITVRLAEDGTIAVKNNASGNPVNFVIDLEGYFTDPTITSMETDDSSGLSDGLEQTWYIESGSTGAVSSDSTATTDDSRASMPSTTSGTNTNVQADGLTVLGPPPTSVKNAGSSNWPFCPFITTNPESYTRHYLRLDVADPMVGGHADINCGFQAFDPFTGKAIDGYGIAHIYAAHLGQWNDAGSPTNTSWSDMAAWSIRWVVYYPDKVYLESNGNWCEDASFIEKKGGVTTKRWNTVVILGKTGVRIITAYPTSSSCSEGTRYL